MRLNFSWVIVSLLPIYLLAQTSPISNHIGKSIDQYLERAVPFGFSGAVLVAKDGEIILNCGYGYADRERQIKNSSAMVYSTGSITKQFTAAAIMKLEMMGKVNTDDHLTQHLDDVPEDKKEITLHNLLTHTSGLPQAFSSDDFETITKEDYLQRSLEAPLRFAPGSEFLYSNVGYVLLAMVIEKTSGLSYEEFLNQHLFQPAGMTQTGYSLPQWDNRHFTHIYDGTTDNGTTAQLTKPTWHLIGNGGILSTTGDMYLWIKALSNENILSESAKQKMFTPFKNQYGYGWDVLDRGNLRQHNGGSHLGNGAELRWFVEDNLVTIIFTNSTLNGRKGFAIVRNELEALTIGDQVSLPPKITTVPADLTAYQGMYRLPSGDQFKIEISADGARLLVTSQELLDLLLTDVDHVPSETSHVKLHSALVDAFKKIEQKGDYSGLEFMSAAEQLKKEILNELDMEGISNPHFRVISTLPSQRSKGITITKVAINRNQDFSGESLILNLACKDEKFAGVAVDFGPADPISLGMYPIGENTFQLYDFQLQMGFQLEIQNIKGQEYAFIVRDRKLKATKQSRR